MAALKTPTNNNNMAKKKQKFTDADAKELGIKKEVLETWGNLMQALWIASIALYQTHNTAEYFPVNGENEIIIGGRFTIDGAICNNSYVQARLWDKQGEKLRAEIRYEGISATTLCKCFVHIISDLQSNQ